MLGNSMFVHITFQFVAAMQYYKESFSKPKMRYEQQKQKQAKNIYLSIFYGIYLKNIFTAKTKV